MNINLETVWLNTSVAANAGWPTRIHPSSLLSLLKTLKDKESLEIFAPPP